MKELSHNLRLAKEHKYDAQTAFDHWVEEYADLHEMSIDNVLKLALFKQENMEYKGAKNEQRTIN